MEWPRISDISSTGMPPSASLGRLYDLVSLGSCSGCWNPIATSSGSVPTSLRPVMRLNTYDSGDDG